MIEIDAIDQKDVRIALFYVMALRMRRSAHILSGYYQCITFANFTGSRPKISLKISALVAYYSPLDKLFEMKAMSSALIY